MEYTAEDLISHKLQRSGILISKPKFDREGTDLIALMQVKDGTRFCRIQCKGRSLVNSSSSSIKIPKEYVEGAFVTFLYVDDGNENNTHLFAFFVDEMRKWKENNDKYVLNFTKTNFESLLAENRFSPETVVRIQNSIKHSNVRKELPFVLPPVMEIRGDNIVYQDGSKIVRVEYSEDGRLSTIIRDKLTGTEKVGTSCPGEPRDFEYNANLDTWTKK